MQMLEIRYPVRSEKHQIVNKLSWKFVSTKITYPKNKIRGNILQRIKNDQEERSASTRIYVCILLD